MEQPLVSIIVPCFNSDDRFLNDAVQSVLLQTYTVWELLLVDDGSDASTKELLDALVETDKRIRCIHKKNGGVSSARNAGIEAAEGVYAFFLDDDDMLAPYCLAEAVSVMKKTGADIILGGTQLLYSETEQKRLISDGIITVCSSNDMRKKLVSSDDLYRFEGGHIGRGAWARLIKMELAREVLFNENISFGEDILWNQRVLSIAGKCARVESVWYYYVQYKASGLTRSFFRDLHIQVQKEMEALKQCVDLTDDDFYRSYCDHMLEEMRRIARLELAGVPARDKYSISRKLYTQMPWTVIFEKRYWNMCSRRKKIVIMLCRMHMYLWIKLLFVVNC